MKIVAHVNKFYDWAPVPADVQVTDADVKAMRVKSSGGGGWLMRVTREVPTHTDIQLPESQIIALIIEGIIRDKVALTRRQAVSTYMARHVMPHHAHKSWMTGFEVSDDGPDEALFTAKVTELSQALNASGNPIIDPLDIPELLEAYMEPFDADEHDNHAEAHAAHMCKHFNVKVAK